MIELLRQPFRVTLTLHLGKGLAASLLLGQKEKANDYSYFQFLL